ncbi:SH3 domain-containing protein [Sphingomonas sp.]|uniref:SH3 domain-containing protein n=1 Tax=Sphingomonas sp. TaxID=28214 RepID=UPI002DD6900A|nr:SH3 domain-containing protein [Sphingomonas sp.]
MAKFFGKAVLAAGVALCWTASPAAAQKGAEPVLAKCEQSLGSIAIVDGDTQGWTKYGLSSPRDLIAAMAAQSGCFTLHNAASGKPADFLMNAIAGDKEEVDQGMNIARTALVEGAVRSGALGAVAGRVPVVGGMLGGMLGGFGGKKKTVAAGLRIISPATGQTLVTGSGQTSKTSVSIGGFGGYGGNPWADAARAQMGAMGYGDFANGGYATSKDGKMLTSAFVEAFNGVVAQGGALASMKR